LGETVDNETRVQFGLLNAETMALQALLVALMNRLKQNDPTLAQVFDDANDIIELLCSIGGKGAGHLPECLKIIEELRASVAGKSDPKHRV
jgi:hypothetical protein